MKYKIDNKYVVDADSPKQAMQRFKKFEDSCRDEKFYKVNVKNAEDRDVSRFITAAQNIGFTTDDRGFVIYLKNGNDDMLRNLKSKMHTTSIIFEDSKKLKDSYFIVACEQGDFWYNDFGKPDSFKNAKKFSSYEEADRWRRNKGSGSVQKVTGSTKDSYKDSSKEELMRVAKSLGGVSSRKKTSGYVGIEIRNPEKADEFANWLEKNHHHYNSNGFEFFVDVDDSIEDAKIAKLGTLKPGDRFYDRRYKEDCVLLECDRNDCRIKSLKTGLVFRMSPNAEVEIKDSICDIDDEEAMLVNGYKVFKSNSNGNWFVFDGDGYHNEVEYKFKGYPYKEDAINRAKSLNKGRMTSIDDSEIDYLTQEEEQAVEDYRKAIQNTTNPKLLEIYAHILKEETEHIAELKEAKKIDE